VAARRLRVRKVAALKRAQASRPSNFLEKQSKLPARHALWNLRQLHFYQLSFSNFFPHAKSCRPWPRYLYLLLSLLARTFIWCRHPSLSWAWALISARGQKNEVGRRNVFTSGAVFSFRRGGARTTTKTSHWHTDRHPLLFCVPMLRAFVVVIGIAPLLTPIYISRLEILSSQAFDVHLFWKGRIEEEHGCFLVPSKWDSCYQSFAIINIELNINSENTVVSIHKVLIHTYFIVGMYNKSVAQSFYSKISFNCFAIS
jgi:hypothetical protein